MRNVPEHHGILGAGAVGGLIAGLLAAGGEDVTLVVRPSAVASYPARMSVRRSNESVVGGPVRVVAALSAGDAPHVLWVTTKATQLGDALGSVAQARPATVVPLLNGIDHIALLEATFGHDAVIPATIAVEAERAAAGETLQRSPFISLHIAERGRAALKRAVDILAAYGASTTFEANETTLMWAKLAFLAPFALTTTAADADMGFIRAHTEWLRRFEDAAAETTAAGTAEGAVLDVARALAMVSQVPPTMRSSMWRDVAAGHVPELDAIGGAVVRAAERHGLAVPVTRDLIARVAKRAAVGR